MNRGLVAGVYAWVLDCALTFAGIDLRAKRD
jgi:hypothetical protein